jgi:hypothetical protein
MIYTLTHTFFLPRKPRVKLGKMAVHHLLHPRLPRRRLNEWRRAFDSPAVIRLVRRTSHLSKEGSKKSVIFALGTVVLLGCVEQPSNRSVAQPPRAAVFDELAAAVKGALAAKTSKTIGWFSTVQRSSGWCRG